MITRLFFILTFLLAISAVTYVSASPVSVPLDHWCYHFIERFQAKGVLRDFQSNIKPYSRDEVAEMIFYISNLKENGKISLSKVEEKQLEDLKKKFAPELIDLGMAGLDEYKHLVDWTSGGKRLVTELGFSQIGELKRGTEDYYKLLSEFRVNFWGNLEGGLFFYNDTRASYEHTDEPIPLWHPYLDLTRYPWTATSDSYLVFRLPYADIQAGKDAILWGPGYNGVVGLSGVDPTFDMIRLLPIEVWKLKFSSILGFLRDDLAKEYKSDLVRKYLSAHRVELNLLPGLSIGWQEMYVYAENLHIELLNPIMPYQMAEDYLGDVGNNTMEGDIDLCLVPNTRLYASLFLDDFHPDESLFTYTANRWAALAGVFIVDPPGLDNFDIRAEYARVEPWVYPHKGIVQDPPIPTSYKHFDTPLGHWIGPNADDLFLEANYRISEDLTTALSYDRVRKGEIGGSLYDYDATAMGKEKHFLMGIVEKSQTVRLGLNYRIFQDSTAEISYSFTKVHNKQKEEAKLPSSDSRKEPWVTGREWEQSFIEAAVRLRY